MSCARRSPDETPKDPGSIPGTSTADQLRRLTIVSRRSSFYFDPRSRQRSPAAVIVARTVGTVMANAAAPAFVRPVQDSWGSATATTATTAPTKMAMQTSRTRVQGLLSTEQPPCCPHFLPIIMTLQALTNKTNMKFRELQFVSVEMVETWRGDKVVRDGHGELCVAHRQRTESLLR